jgi:hypothetical protein
VIHHLAVKTGALYLAVVETGILHLVAVKIGVLYLAVVETGMVVLEIENLGTVGQLVRVELWKEVIVGGRGWVDVGEIRAAAQGVGVGVDSSGMAGKLGMGCDESTGEDTEVGHIGGCMGEGNEGLC